MLRGMLRAPDLFRRVVVAFGLAGGGVQVTYKVAVVRDEKARELEKKLAAGGLGAAVGSATSL
eukprot:COSAG02_NODE_8318_length_2618_cov_1.533148_1_plen_63_part_00